jgi:hypothetical protein
MKGKTDHNDLANPELTRQLVNAAMKPKPAVRFPITRMGDIKAILDGQWLVKHLLPAQGLAVIYGPPGCGKSFLTLDTALHVAMGLPWAGKGVKQAAVIYIAAEGGHGFANRIVAARYHLNVPDDVPFGLITVAPNLGTEKGDAALLIREIKAQVDPLGWTVGLIVVDTLSRAMAGADENAAADMGRFVRNIDHVSKAFHCLGVAVHHTGKDAERGMRGSSALHGAADAEWEISEDDAGKFVRLAKQKDGRDDLVWRFHLYPVVLGTDETGENVSSCGVKVTSEPEPMKQESGGKNVSRRKLKGQKALVMKAVRTAIEEMGERLPGSNHMPDSTRGARRQHIQIYAEKLGFLEGKTDRVARSTLDRLLRDLHGDRYIGRWDDWLWLVDETE